MRGNGYQGSVCLRSSETSEVVPSSVTLVTATKWNGVQEDAELSLEVRGQYVQRYVGDAAAVMVRGLMAAPALAPRERPAEALWRYYRDHGEVPVDLLEGSFTLAVLDGKASRVLLYRNLVGAGFTYYTVADDGFHFGSNLADLWESCPASAAVNEEALPAFFLFRFVPGRQTLFDGFYRLLPGEQVVFDARGLRRVQRQTFADLRQGPLYRRDAVERLEQTMAEVLGGQAALGAETANLLSGGVDSSYVQAVWNGVRQGGSPSRSFSIAVDHPRTRPDSDYALQAARALGTRHTLVPADDAYLDYLLEALATTAEPPNHVMSAYFPLLARTMVAHDAPVGLCGEGADSLFGISAADSFRLARFLRRLLPARWLRRWGKSLAGTLGRQYLAGCCELADFLHTPLLPQHPFNQVAVFTDWPAVESCFGAKGVQRALGSRQDLLEQYQVGANPLERLHALGYLGEAADSASLWATLFNSAGGELFCPYLDSRLLGLTLRLDQGERFPFRRPKELLKRALARHVPAELAFRPKRGFGQPIFEWLRPGGQLRPWVERISRYPFVPAATQAVALAWPSWFLYSLLCFDLWHKLFIDRSLSRHTLVAPARRAEAPPQRRVSA